MKKYILIAMIFFIHDIFAQECTGIKKTVDEFKDEIRFSFDGLKNVSFTSYIEKSGISYYLSLTNTGYSLNIKETGVYIILENGEKIVKPNIEIDCEFEPDHYYGQGDYEYSAFIPLSEQDVIKMSKNPIKKFRLFIYDKELSTEDIEDQKGLIKCLLTMTKK